MRILQVLNTNQLGGGEIVAINVAASLKQKSIYSKVLVPGKGPAYDECTQRNIKTSILRYDPEKIYSTLQHLLQNVLFKIRYASGRSTILHFHSPFIYGIFSRSLLYSNVKSVVHVHLETEDEGLQWAFRFPPDTICVCAKYLEGMVQRNLISHGKAKGSITILPNAIDLNIFYPGDKHTIRNKFNIDQRVVFILMVADLASHKGQETAIRSIFELKRQNINACLWLIGKSRSESNDYVLSLEKIISDLNLNHEVKFMGFREDVPEIMRAADCLFLPSTREGLPLSILEAQASGLAVIAAPTAGIPEAVIDGKTGFLVDASDWKGYADTVRLLLTEPDLRFKITEKALSVCRAERGWSKYINNLIDTYVRLT